MRKKVLLLTGSLLLGANLAVWSQAAETEQPVRFVNTGHMWVAAQTDNEGVSLYVLNSVLMTDKSGLPSAAPSSVEIVQEGITSIGGSFYQESKGQVFTVDTDGWGTDEGTIEFLDNATANTSKARYISAATKLAMESFERANRYVAFPNISIATNDTIFLPGRMGIDAATIKRKSGKAGVLYLKSEEEGASGAEKIFDASLRISAVGAASTATSADLVDAGSVTVERNIRMYRNDAGGVKPIFPFASPYTNLHAGYFAGNFVRKFAEDGNKHVQFVLANKDNAPTDGIIDEDQYIRGFYNTFEAKKGYLIVPKTNTFNYGDLNLIETGSNSETDFHIGTFVFDGSAFGHTFTGAETEQLFADKNLFTKTLSGYNGTTLNWIIGNSYTSALSVKKLIAALKANPSLKFSDLIYLYPAGATGYQPYDISGTSAIVGANTLNLLNDLEDIPSMNYVMVRVSNSQTQSGTLTIDRDMQTHGKVSHNLRAKEQKQYFNEAVFRVSPASNANVYDLAMVALRGEVSGSVSKIINSQNPAFHLYAGNKRSIAVEQPSVEYIPLGFIPSKSESSYTISVSRGESMETEGFWLEDRKTGVWTDLRSASEYAFEAAYDDDETRFFVHFSQRTITDDQEINDTQITIHHQDNEVVIRGLVETDLGANIRIMDISGRTLYSGKITACPQEAMTANLASGVYVISVEGNRNKTSKIIVKEGGIQ